MTHIEGMRTPNLPPTRENIAASSGEWLALFDCLECSRGVYIPGPQTMCSYCGATPPSGIRAVMNDIAEKNRAA